MVWAVVHENAAIPYSGIASRFVGIGRSESLCFPDADLIVEYGLVSPMVAMRQERLSLLVRIAQKRPSCLVHCCEFGATLRTPRTTPWARLKPLMDKRDPVQEARRILTFLAMVDVIILESIDL